MTDLIVINKDTMTSREIAELTSKEHSNVMRDIRSLLEQGVGQFNFEPSSYINSQNKQQPMYILTKEGSLILASGYSALLREKIVNRWLELENALKPQLPTDYLSALKALVESEEQKLLLQQTIEVQKPLVEFAEHVSQSVNSISIGNFAKLLADENIKIGQNRLFIWLRNNKYLDRNNMPYQIYIERGYFEIIEQTFKTPYGNKTNLKTLITGKGQIYFTEKLRNN